MPKTFDYQQCADLMATALEGSGYWLREDDIRNLTVIRDYDTNEVTVIRFECEERAGIWTLRDVRISDIQEAITKICAGAMDPTTYTAKILLDPTTGPTDYDVEVADCVFQMAAFGEIIYG